MIDTRDSSLFGTRNPMEGEVRIPSGCAIAGIFHKKLLTIRELKEYLNKNGVEMRL